MHHKQRNWTLNTVRSYWPSFKLQAAASSSTTRIHGTGTGSPCRWQFYRKYLARALVRLLLFFFIFFFFVFLLLFSLRASANVPLGCIDVTRSAFNAMLERDSKWKLACSILLRFVFLRLLYCEVLYTSYAAERNRDTSIWQNYARQSHFVCL